MPPAVYILASARHGTLYVRSTTLLRRRVQKHRCGLASAFTRRYGLQRLVYYEFHADKRAARARERQLKKWERKWKLELIDQANPAWTDLYIDLDELC